MKETTKTLCPTCGRPYIPPQKVEDALKLMKAGVRLSAAARAAGISKQRLGQIIKFRASVNPSGRKVTK